MFNPVFIFSALLFVFLFLAIILAISLRRVVPTNMVHIVQSSKKTVPYGRDKQGGNTYYEFPSWVPFLGVSVSKFPESNFQVDLKGYDAFDSAKLPFSVDITAFFRIEDAAVAAQRVASHDVLVEQLRNVVQGAVRSVLASSTLEEIMHARATLAKSFTDQVELQLKEWGVKTVKAIEFMDIRDSGNNEVIEQITSRDKARVDRESREQIAQHNQAATEAEISAKRSIQLKNQEAQQAVGTREAQAKQAVGIADEQSRQAIAVEAVTTAEKDLEVQRVRDVTAAEISKQVAAVTAEQNRAVAVTDATAAKEVLVLEASAQKETLVVRAQGERDAQIQRAEGDLVASQKEAEGVQALGEARAAAEQALLLAPVEAQTKLAQEIGSNQGYQQYLITIEQVRAGKDVGIEMARAMQKADLKVIANSSDMQQGVAQLGDIFTPAGGTRLSGMLAALGQTDEGAALIQKFGGPAVVGKALAAATGSTALGALAGVAGVALGQAPAGDTPALPAPEAA